MAEGIGMALGAMVFYGFSDWVYKRAATSGVKAHHFLFLQACFFSPGIFLYSFMTDSLVLGKPFALGMAAGALTFTALYNFAFSLASGMVSIVAPVFRLSFAITVALALWLLDEPLTGVKLVGLAAALGATWLILAGGPKSARKSASALLRLFVATVAMGLVSFIYKLAALAGGSPATVIAGQACVFLPLAVLFAFSRGQFRPPPGAWGYGATAGLLLLGAQGMLLSALAHGEASVLVPVAQLSFVVTSVLGFVFLRETLSLRKACGLLCAILALICFAF